MVNNVTDSQDDFENIRVRINDSKKNKAKGFYLLITNTNTQSDKKYEFIIERRFLRLLEDNKIHFEELPLNPN